MNPSLCKTAMRPKKAISQHMCQSMPASNKFNNNDGLALIMSMLLNISMLESMTLAKKYFNRSGESFIAFNRKNNTVLYRENEDTTENYTFEEIFTRLVLETVIS